MEVVIRGTKEKDFPSLVDINDQRFLGRMEESIRRRLELRPTDTVIFEITDK